MMNPQDMMNRQEWERIEPVIQNINTDIKRFPWMDFRITGFQESGIGGNLFVCGTIDASYGDQVEIEFSDVLYMDCATVWQTDAREEAVFFVKEARLLDDNAFRKFFENGSGVVVVFCAEDFPGKKYFHIVCRKVAYAAVSNINTYLYRGERETGATTQKQMNRFEFSFPDESWGT